MTIRYALVGVSLALLAGCRAMAPDSPLAPSPPASTAAASIQLTVATRTDSRLDLAAEVLTASRTPVVGATVTFTVTRGTLTSATAVTDSAGFARTIASDQWQNTITASSAGFTDTQKLLGVVPDGPTPISLEVLASSVIYDDETTQLGVSLSGADTPRVVQWNFGDGATSSANTFTPTHQYGAGSFTVSLSIADALGRTASASKRITVSTRPATTPFIPPSITVSIICTTVTPLRQSCTATPFFGADISSLVSAMTMDWGDGGIEGITPGIAKVHDYGARGRSYTLHVTGTLRTGESFAGTYLVYLS